MTWSEGQADALVEGAFAALLGRQPDEEGRRFYIDHLVHGRLSVEQFLAQLTASAEFAEKRLQMGQRSVVKAAVEACLARPEVTDLSSRLAAVDAGHRSLVDSHAEAARLPTDAILGQATYVVDHRRRFHELFHAVAVLTEGLERPRILEFGPSVFSVLYERLFPRCRLVIADRPPAPGSRGVDAVLGGYFASPTTWVEADLLGDLSAAAALLDRHGPFDLVVFTEVLEHLARHPTEIVAFLLGRLDVGGSLYLTTPNALAHWKLHLIGTGRNAQQMPPRQDTSGDAHYHVREYSMSELVEIVNDAGGRVRALHFSACWDQPDYLDYLDQHPDQRGDLVVVASRIWSGLDCAG